MPEGRHPDPVVGLAAIQWDAPWLAPYAQAGRAVAQRVAAGIDCPQALNALAESRPDMVRFVGHGELPPGQAYESYIFETNSCPTREGLHDFFNGLAWLTFPQTKRRLNQLHVAQLAQTGIARVRGPARDACTVLDENAAFFQGPDALWDALAAKDWHRLMVELRPCWSEARLVLFGHALLEKLVHPRKAITAHVYRASPVGSSIAELDAWVASDFSAEKLAAKPFAHLPVLGIPGWWAANEEASFYEDASVFRAARLDPP
jgi:hypothetical protein